MERKDDADYVKPCTRLVVEGTAPVGTPQSKEHLAEYSVCRQASAKS